MKKGIWLKINSMSVLAVFLFLSSCKQNSGKANADLAINAIADEIKYEKKPLTEEFKKYWYNGEAEITSYTLEQAQYGELREGTSVLIFVTEPFDKAKQVKADESKSSNIPVLKLNSTKNYLTGIYPYSIMSSSFYPVHNNQHAVKVSFSAQEWCGHVYAQLNNRDQFEVTSHSYFESSADQNQLLNKAILENELWNMIRINPESLPTGEQMIIPSMEFIRLSHQELKSYKANLSLNTSDGLSTYEIAYPELKRELKINFTSSFPYTIESWTESFTSNYGKGDRKLTSKATKLKSIKSPYWQKNSNRFLPLRDSLGL